MVHQDQQNGPTIPTRKLSHWKNNKRNHSEDKYSHDGYQRISNAGCSMLELKLFRLGILVVQQLLQLQHGWHPCKPIVLHSQLWWWFPESSAFKHINTMNILQFQCSFLILLHGDKMKVLPGLNLSTQVESPYTPTCPLDLIFANLNEEKRIQIIRANWVIVYTPWLVEWVPKLKEKRLPLRVS